MHAVVMPALHRATPVHPTGGSIGPNSDWLTEQRLGIGAAL